jgi:hypothetical protein
MGKGHGCHSVDLGVDQGDVAAVGGVDVTHVVVCVMRIRSPE